MSYTAMYRRFRPTTFEEVKGQDAIVTTLKNQIRSDRIGHAYLFCGTRGTGKTSIAKLFAKSVNCEHPVDGSPCGECASCKAIAEGRSMNVIEIDAASNNGVDNIREIVNEVAYSPTEGKYRVYIIDEVHMLSAGAFNALLKTLEEPPSYVIFLLTCGAASSLLPTVRSRAQIFRVQKEDNPQTEESEAFLLAESMAKAVPSAREYDLVSKTGTLTKDKELFRAVLKELALIFRDACALAAGGESQVTASQAAGYLAQRLTRKKLMALLEAVLEAQAMLERNVNQTLLAAWMCAKLK